MKLLVVIGLLALEARGFMVVRKNATNVTSTDGWDLYAMYQHEYLDVRTQAGGIELSTRSEPRGLVRFQGKTNEIRCGDLVAIAVEGTWLRYDASKRPLEISAEVHADPIPSELYQWRIGGCRAGEPLATNRPFAIANINAKDALVGCRRIYGPPFCWDEQQLMGLERKKEQ